MYTIDADILNTLGLVASLDYQNEDIRKSRTAVLNILRDHMNLGNEGDVVITGKLFEYNFDWLWITIPLDEDGRSELLSRLGKKNASELNDIDWVEANAFREALFYAVEKSRTKFSMKFSDDQEKITGFPKYGINTLFQGKVLEIKAEAAKNITSAAFATFHQLKKIYLQSAETIGDSAFIRCSKLEEVNLPKAKKIGELGDPQEENYFGTFRECKKLAKVELPSAQTIGNGTFLECYALEKLALPEAKIIGAYAFYECEKLTTILLPKVETIDIGAFYGCKSITDISLDNVETIGEHAFWGCESLRKVHAPKVISVSKEAFANCPNLRKY